VKLATCDPVQVRVGLPEPPLMLVEDSVHKRLDELVVTVSVTVPVNPFAGATVIVEVLAVPTVAGTLVGLAEIVKSGTTAAATW